MIPATNLNVEDLRRRVIRDVEAISKDVPKHDRIVRANANHLVTSLDEYVHEQLCNVLPTILDVDILSEEHVSSQLSTDLIWVIDPIDGTANAAVGNNEYAVSIALYSQADQRSLAGVVHLPAQNVTYSATTDEGAYRNDRRLVGAQAQNAPSIFAIGVPADASDRLDLFLRRYRLLLQNGVYTRQSGSAAIDICRVAESQWTGFHQYGIKLWDIAAADIIARESGCTTRRTESQTHAKDEYTLDYLALNSYNILDFNSML
jgi:myo-inositol-1(or 4)-monophosphatase